MFTILTLQKYKRIFILSTFSCYLFAFKVYVFAVSYLKPLICFDLLQIRFKDGIVKSFLFGIVKGCFLFMEQFFHCFTFLWCPATFLKSHFAFRTVRFSSSAYGNILFNHKKDTMQSKTAVWISRKPYLEKYFDKSWRNKLLSKRRIGSVAFLLCNLEKQESSFGTLSVWIQGQNCYPSSKVAFVSSVGSCCLMGWLFLRVRILNVFNLRFSCRYWNSIVKVWI